jgi:DNA invertase Pin-like site-specific DNA recombinase
LTIHVLAAVAEAEAEAISTRTKAALAVARARGVKLGGYRVNSATIYRKGVKASVKARSQAAQARAEDLTPVIEAIKADGATSLRQIAAVLNKRQIPSARGGQWSATQVQRVMDRARYSDAP